MFIVTQSQLQQLDNLYLDRLVRDIQAHVQTFFPDEYARLDADASDHWIREGIRRARGYGLSTDRNITVFVDFLMTYDVSFPMGYDWGKSILDDESLSEDQKIESLLAAIDE